MNNQRFFFQVNTPQNDQQIQDPQVFFRLSYIMDIRYKHTDNFVKKTDSKENALIAAFMP